MTAFIMFTAMVNQLLLILLLPLLFFIGRTKDKIHYEDLVGDD